MWVLVVILSTLSGQPISIGEFNKTFATEQECKDAAPDIVDKADKELASQNAVISGAKCMLQDDRDKLKAKLAGAKDDGSI